MRTTICFAIFAIVLFFPAGSAEAGKCGYQDCWGAVGIGVEGSYGYSFGKWSEEEAYRSLQKRCRWNCFNVRSFTNACGAIARGKNGRWAAGVDPNLNTARKQALHECGLEAVDCKVEVWACSP